MCFLFSLCGNLNVPWSRVLFSIAFIVCYACVFYYNQGNLTWPSLSKCVNHVMCQCTSLQGYFNAGNGVLGDFYLFFYSFSPFFNAKHRDMDISFTLLVGFVALRKAVCCVGQGTDFLSTFTTDSAGQLDVLGHDGDTLGMDGTQVGVFKQTNQVSFTGLLQSHNSRALESQVGLEVLCDFSHQTLEWQLADEKFSALLVPTDLTESHSSRPVTMGLLNSSSGWGTLTSSLGGQLFPGGLSSSGFTGCLLGTSHCNAEIPVQNRVQEQNTLKSGKNLFKPATLELIPSCPSLIGQPSQSQPPDWSKGEQGKEYGRLASYPGSPQSQTLSPWSGIPLETTKS